MELRYPNSVGATMADHETVRLQPKHSTGGESSSHQSGGSHGSTASWRKQGERLRQAVIDNDERKGGQAFLLSSSCPIHRYYHVADKVLDQFLHHPIDSPDELMESYTVGHRLVKFLSKILPTHDDYFSKETDENDARNRSLEQLVAVLKYLDQIAMLIDKHVHEDYIRAVLTEQDELHEWDEENAARSGGLEDSYYGDNGDDEPIPTIPVSPLARSNINLTEPTMKMDSIHQGIDQSSKFETVSKRQSVATPVAQREVTPENSFGSASSPAQSTPSPRAATNPWLAASKTAPQPPPQPPQPLTPLTQSARTARSEHRREKPGFRDGMTDPHTNDVADDNMAKDSESAPTLSPGSSRVQSRVKAWPPKPDPPEQHTFKSKALEPLDSSVEVSPNRVGRSQHSRSSVESTTTSSSVDSSKMADRTSTPQPNEQHSGADVSPESVRPLLQVSSNTSDSARLHFKPLTELKIQGVDRKRETAFKKSTQSNGRVRWADANFSSVPTRRADRSGFSSSSCSSRESEDLDPYTYSSIHPPDQSKTTDQAASKAHEQMDISKSRPRGATSTSDWQVGNDAIDVLGSASKVDHGDERNAVAARGNVGGLATDSQKLETIGSPGPARSIPNLDQGDRERNGVDESTDSSGFPFATNITTPYPHQSGTFNDSRDSSLFSKIPEMEDTSGSAASASPRSFGMGANANSDDFLSSSLHKLSSSFNSVMFDRGSSRQKVTTNGSEERVTSKETIAQEDARLNASSSSLFTSRSKENAPVNNPGITFAHAVGVPPTQVAASTSTSYAPSVADWDAYDNGSRHLKRTTGSSLSLDSMGFFVQGRYSMPLESLAKGSTVSGATRSPTALKPTGGISYAVPQSLVADGPFTGKLSRPGWTDDWETVLEGDKFSNDATTKLPVTFPSSALAHGSMARSGIPKDQYPRARGSTLDRVKSSLAVDHASRPFGGSNHVARSCTRVLAREFQEQRDSKSSTKRATYSRRSQGFSTSPWQVECPISPYMSESKAEQRLKYMKGEPSLGRKRQPAAPVIELTPSTSLELMQNRSSKSDKWGQGNKVLRFKQRGAGAPGFMWDHHFLNELDSLDSSGVLVVKNHGPGYHFKSCVRCLID